MEEKGKFWTLEKVLGFSALLVSLSTLVVFVYQTNLIRKQQYMAVYPHLDVTNYYSFSAKYEYVLQNKGVGPAFIKSISVETGDSTYSSIRAYVNDNIEPAISINYRYTDFFVGQLVSEKEYLKLFEFPPVEELEERGLTEAAVARANQLYEVLNHDSINIAIRYASIYDEVWEISGDSSIPVKVDQ